MNYELRYCLDIQSLMENIRGASVIAIGDCNVGAGDMNSARGGSTLTRAVFHNWDEMYPQIDPFGKELLDNMRAALNSYTLDEVGDINAVVCGMHWQKSYTPLYMAIANSGFVVDAPLYTDQPGNILYVKPPRLNIRAMRRLGLLFLPKVANGARNRYLRQAFGRLFRILAGLEPEGETVTRVGNGKRRIPIIVFGAPKGFRKTRLVSQELHDISHYHAMWNNGWHPSSVQYCDAFAYHNAKHAPIDWGALFRADDTPRFPAQLYDPLTLFYSQFHTLFTPEMGYISYAHATNNLAWSYVIFSHRGLIAATDVDPAASRAKATNYLFRHIIADGLYPCNVMTSRKAIANILYYDQIERVDHGEGRVVSKCITGIAENRIICTCAPKGAHKHDYIDRTKYISDEDAKRDWIAGAVIYIAKLIQKRRVDRQC